MKPEIKFQSYAITLASFLIFGVWLLLIRLTYLCDWIAAITTGLISFGVYKIVVVILSSILRKVKSIRKFILGPYYLEGIWVGFYIGYSNQVRFLIETFEQDLDYLVIRGKSFDDRLNFHGTWTTDITNIDIKKGRLTYMYDVTTLRDISNNVGVASFNFERKNQFTPPIKLIGYSADLHVSKKIKAIEVKIEENLTDLELIGKAQEVYDRYKNSF
jgi:hypothetical protein